VYTLEEAKLLQRRGGTISEENVSKCIKSSGYIDRYFWKTVRREATSRIHNIIAKPDLQYGSKPWMLEEDKCRIKLI
jgi:hypothetical protein